MEFTRRVIKEAFGQLLDEKPMNKITVKDIAERCDVNRNTFYYHFRDIPALFEEMMGEKVDLLLQKHFQADQPIQCIQPMIQYGLAHRRAILHVYRAIPREDFLSYMNRIAQHFVEEYVASATRDHQVSPENAAIIIHFYRCSIVGLLLDWLDAGMNYDALALSRRICALFEGTGRQALSKQI